MTNVGNLDWKKMSIFIKKTSFPMKLKGISKTIVFEAHKFTRDNWEANTPKPSDCLVCNMVQRHRAGSRTNSQWRPLMRLVNWLFFPKIEEEDLANIRFQQNGDSAHTANDTIAVLRPILENRTKVFGLLVRVSFFSKCGYYDISWSIIKLLNSTGI